MSAADVAPKIIGKMIQGDLRADLSHLETPKAQIFLWRVVVADPLRERAILEPPR
jgi:hypothetical protein